MALVVGLLLVLLASPAGAAVYSHLIMDDAIRIGQVPTETGHSGGYHSKIATTSSYVPTGLSGARAYGAVCIVDSSSTGTGNEQDGYCEAFQVTTGSTRAHVWYSSQTYSETRFSTDARGAADFRTVGLSAITTTGDVSVEAFTVSYTDDSDDDGYTRWFAISDGSTDFTTTCAGCTEGKFVHWNTTTNAWTVGMSAATEFYNGDAEWVNAAGIDGTENYFIAYNDEPNGDDFYGVVCYIDTAAATAPSCGTPLQLRNAAQFTQIQVEYIGEDGDGNYDLVVGGNYLTFCSSTPCPLWDKIEVNSSTRAITWAGGNYGVYSLSPAFYTIDGRDVEIAVNDAGTGMVILTGDGNDEHTNVGVVMGIFGIDQAAGDATWGVTVPSFTSDGYAVIETDENASHPEAVFLDDTTVLVSWVPSDNSTPGRIARVYDVDWTGGTAGGPKIVGVRPGTYSTFRDDMGGTSVRGVDFDGDMWRVPGVGEVYMVSMDDSGDDVFVNHGRFKPQIEDGELLWGLSFEVPVLQTVDPADPGLLWDSFVGTGPGYTIQGSNTPGEVGNDRVGVFSVGTGSTKGGCIDLPQPMESLAFYFQFNQPSLFSSSDPRNILEMRSASGVQAMLELDPKTRTLSIFQGDRDVKECLSSFVNGKICFDDSDCDAEDIGEGDEGVPKCVDRVFGTFQPSSGWSTTVTNTIPHAFTVVFAKTADEYEVRAEMGVGGSSFIGTTKPTGVCDDADSTTEGDPCTTPGTGGVCGTGDCVNNSLIPAEPVTSVCFGAGLEAAVGPVSFLADNLALFAGADFEHGYFLDYTVRDNASNSTEMSNSGCSAGDEALCLDDFSGSGTSDGSGLDAEAQGELVKMQAGAVVTLDSGNTIGRHHLFESAMHEKSSPGTPAEFYLMWGALNTVFTTLPWGFTAGVDLDSLLSNENPDVYAPFQMAMSGVPWSYGSSAPILLYLNNDWFGLLAGHFDADAALSTQVDNLTTSFWVDKPATTFEDAVVDRNGNGSITLCFGVIGDSRIADRRIYEPILSQLPSVDNALMCAIGGSQWGNSLDYRCMGGTNDQGLCDPTNCTTGDCTAECPSATNPTADGGTPCRMNYEFAIQGKDQYNGTLTHWQCGTVLRGVRDWCDVVVLEGTPGNDYTGRPVPPGMGFIVQDINGDGTPDGATGDPCSYDAPFEHDTSQLNLAFPQPAGVEGDTYCLLGPNAGTTSGGSTVCEGGTRNGLAPSVTTLCSGGSRDGLAPLEQYVCTTGGAACSIQDDQCAANGPCIEQDICPGTGTGGAPAIPDFGCPSPTALKGATGVRTTDCGQFLTGRERADTSGPKTGWVHTPRLNATGNVETIFGVPIVSLLIDDPADYATCDQADSVDHWTMKATGYRVKGRIDGYHPVLADSTGATCVATTGIEYMEDIMRRALAHSKALNEDTGDIPCDWCTGGDCTDDLGGGNEAQCNDHDVVVQLSNRGYPNDIAGLSQYHGACFARYAEPHQIVKSRVKDILDDYAPTGQSSLDFIDVDLGFRELCTGSDARSCLADGGHILESGTNMLGEEDSGYPKLQEMLLRCFQDEFGSTSYVDCTNTTTP